MKTLEKEFVISLIKKYGKNLSKINLSNNGMEDITQIVHLAEYLIKLNLSKNSLRHISPLARLTFLNELNLSENQMYVLCDYLTITLFTH